MIAHAKTLYDYRDLLWMWTVREVKVRYKQSILGAAWAILQPLSLTLIFTVVFSYFARVPTDVPYPIFAYTALLPWTFFSTSISFAVPSLINNMSLVSKIYFPKEILPLGAIGAALLDFSVAALVFAGLMIFYRMSITVNVVWILVPVLIQLLLTVGISLLAGAMNVFFRDIRFVIPLALQIWMYASPIIYPVDLVPERFRAFYMLNPMAGIITSYRRILLEGTAPVASDLIVAGAVSGLIFVVGYLYFKRYEPVFADVM